MMSWGTIFSYAAIITIGLTLITGISVAFMFYAGAKYKTEWRNELTVKYNLPPNYWDNR